MELDTTIGPKWATQNMIVDGNTLYIAINNGFEWGNEKGLIGKLVNGFFYRDGDYVRVSDRIAPVAQKGEVLSYNDDDVNFWKGVAEKHIKEYASKKTPAVADTTTEGSDEDIPF